MAENNKNTSDAPQDCAGLRPLGKMGRNTPEDKSPQNGACGLQIDLPIVACPLERLIQVLECRGDLIQKALGADTVAVLVSEDGQKLQFPWWQTRNPEPDECVAYCKFVTALCKYAKSLQRPHQKVWNPENEKYTFRAFLNLIGMSGEDWARARKILLQYLDGDSAGKRKKVKPDD